MRHAERWLRKAAFEQDSGKALEYLINAISCSDITNNEWSEALKDIRSIRERG